MSRAVLNRYLGILEVAIFTCWTCIAACLFDKPVYFNSLFLSPLIFAFCLVTMNLLDRNVEPSKENYDFISRRSKVAGFAVVVIGLLLLFWFGGGSGYFFIYPGLGCLLVYRLRILPREYKLEETIKSFFLVESMVLPVYILLCYVMGPTPLLVPQEMVVLSVVMYMALRLFSMVLIQNAYLKKRLSDFRGIVPIVAAAFFIVGMLAAAALPYAVLLLLYLTYPFKPLFNLVKAVTPHYQAKPVEGADAQGRMLQELQSYKPEKTPHLPAWTWLVAAAIIALIVWIILKRKYDERKALKAAARREVTITRTKLKKQPLELVSTASFVRQTYQQMLRFFEKQGIPILRHETPKEYGARLSSHVKDPATVNELYRFSEIYEKVRYGEMYSDEPKQIKEQVAKLWERIKLLESKQ